MGDTEPLAAFPVRSQLGGGVVRGWVRPAQGSLWPTSRISVSAAPEPVLVGRCPLSASSAPHRHNTPPRHVAGAGAGQSGQIQYNPSLVCRYKVATRSNEVHTLIQLSFPDSWGRRKIKAVMVMGASHPHCCVPLWTWPSLHYNCCWWRYSRSAPQCCAPLPSPPLAGRSTCSVFRLAAAATGC